MSKSTSSSSQSSDEDSAHRNGSYWKARAKVPHLPSWIRNHREMDINSSGEVWGTSETRDGLTLARLKDFKNSPGMHLSRKIRE